MLYSLVYDIHVTHLIVIVGRCTVNTVEKYNPASDTWCELSPMLTPCRGLGAAILEGILYVIGGSDGIAALNQVLLLADGICACLLHVPLFTFSSFSLFVIHYVPPSSSQSPTFLPTSIQSDRSMVRSLPVSSLQQKDIPYHV